MSSSRAKARPTVAVVLVAAEATWVSLCVSAIANTWPHFHMDVSFATLALCGVVATIGATSLRRAIAAVRVRVVVLALSALVVTACGAGLLSSRSVGGSFGAVAVHPWTVVGRIASATSTLSWLLVSLFVARGVLVALARPTFAQVIRSVVVGTLAFMTLFLVLATNHERALDAATAHAAWYFVLFFLAALTLLRLSRARDLEGSASAITVEGPRATWMTILLSPLVALAIVGLLVTSLVGSWGSAIGRGFVDTGHAIAFALVEVVRAFAFVIEKIFSAIAAAISAVVHLFVHRPIGSSSTVHHAAVTSTTIAHNASVRVSVPEAVGLVAIFAVMVVVLVVKITRGIERRRPVEYVADREETSSVFSLRELLARFLAALRRAAQRLVAACSRALLRDRRAARARAHAELASTRGQFRRVLFAAKRAGVARSNTETAREFSLRLSDALGEPFELEAITARYEKARYALVDDRARNDTARNDTAHEGTAHDGTVREDAAPGWLEGAVDEVVAALAAGPSRPETP